MPRIEVDLAKLEHKTAKFSAVNPFQTIPSPELDDGAVIGESIAICRYFQELYPAPNLFGARPLERARVEMWQRRDKCHLLLPIAQVFLHTHPHMAKLEEPQIAGRAAANRPRALRNMTIFDGVLRDRPLVVGRFTVADITGLSRSASPGPPASPSRPSAPSFTSGMRRCGPDRAQQPEFGRIDRNRLRQAQSRGGRANVSSAAAGSAI